MAQVKEKRADDLVRIMNIDAAKLYKGMKKEGSNGSYDNKRYDDGTTKKLYAQYSSTMGNSLWLMQLEKVASQKKTSQEKQADSIDQVNIGTEEIKDKHGRPAIKTINFTDSVIQISFDSGYWKEVVDKDNPENVKYETKMFYDDENGIEFADKKKTRTVHSARELRDMFYDRNKQKVVVNNKEYVMDIRSSSMAREGDCLFIRRNLQKPMQEWNRLGVTLKDEFNVATLRAYESLAKSDISGLITIMPDEILLIDDMEFPYTTSAVVTTLDGDDLVVTPKPSHEGESDIWDGQSLLDTSYFSSEGEQAKGAKLLRSRWFKTAAFNTNIQKYFEDEGIGEYVEDMFGRPVRTKDIKLITTPNSLKFLKMVELSDDFETGDDFTTKKKCYEHWLKGLRDESGTFGVVKAEKESKWFDGTKQQLTYQILNTLPLTKEQLGELIEDDIKYISDLRTDINAFEKHCRYHSIDYNSSMLQMLLAAHITNEDIFRTYELKRLRQKEIEYVVKGVRRGKLKVLNADYAWLFSNPMEMLYYARKQRQEVNLKDVPFPLKGWSVYTKKYGDNVELAGFRNPHISMGSVCHFTNRHIDDIDRYFNLTDNIVVVNARGIDIMPRMGGCDFDSDTSYLTDNGIIVEVAKHCHEKYPTPICDIESDKKTSEPTPANLAYIDDIISNNSIGTLCNKATVFLSYYQDRTNYILNRQAFRERYDSGDKEAIKMYDEHTKYVNEYLADIAKRIKNKDRVTEAERDKISELEQYKYEPVTEEVIAEQERYKTKYYEVVAGLASLVEKEIDMPKSFVKLTDVYDNLSERLKDWEHYGLRKPVTKYQIKSKFNESEHGAILVKYGFAEGDTEIDDDGNEVVVVDMDSINKKKLDAKLREVKELKGIVLECLSKDEIDIRKDFTPFFTTFKIVPRPRFMNDLKTGQSGKKYYSYDEPFLCTMDWVKDWTLTANRAKGSESIDLADLMDKRPIPEGENGEHRKVNNILKEAERTYKKYRKHNVMNDWKKAQDAKDGFMNYLREKKLNDEVVYNVIRRVFKDKDKSKYKNFLLKCLCHTRMDEVVGCFKRIDEQNKVSVSKAKTKLENTVKTSG